MNYYHSLWLQVDEDGRIALSPERLSRYGIKPDVRIRVDEGTNGLYLSRPTRLLK